MKESKHSISGSQVPSKNIPLTQSIKHHTYLNHAEEIELENHAIDTLNLSLLSHCHSLLINLSQASLQVSRYPFRIIQFRNRPYIPIWSDDRNSALLSANPINCIRIFQFRSIVEAHFSFGFHDARDLVPDEGVLRKGVQDDELDHSCGEAGDDGGDGV
jgi:hypothetical protein